MRIVQRELYEGIYLSLDFLSTASGLNDVCCFEGRPMTSLLNGKIPHILNPLWIFLGIIALYHTSAKRAEN